MDLVNSPFDSVSHNVDVRAIGQSEGWYNLRNLGFFLGRLKTYPLNDIDAFQSKAAGKKGCYFFNPLGCSIVLFNREKQKRDSTELTDEIHLPVPIRPLALYSDFKQVKQAVKEGLDVDSNYIGEDRSFSIKIIKEENGNRIKRLIPPEAFVILDLCEWKDIPTGLKYEKKLTDGTVVEKPIEVGIDPLLGRFVFAEGVQPGSSEWVEVSYGYGFSADIGGGPYTRKKTLTDPQKATWAKTVSKHHYDADYSSLGEAISDWNKLEKGKNELGVITILDNATYVSTILENTTNEINTIKMPETGRLVIQAEEMKRPVLFFRDDEGQISSLKVSKAKVLSSNNQNSESPNSTLTLNGLLISGSLQIKKNSLKQLNLIH